MALSIYHASNRTIYLIFADRPDGLSQIARVGNGQGSLDNFPRRIGRHAKRILSNQSEIITIDERIT